MTPYYQDTAVTLYHGEAWAVLTALTAAGPLAIDHVISDPPYDAQTHAGARSGALDRPAGIDFPPIDPARVVGLAAPARWSIVFCSMEQLGAYRTATGPQWIRSGFWRTPNGAPQFSGDRPAQPGQGIAIWHPVTRKRWNGGGRPAFYEIGQVARDRVHPTQKPEPLMAALVSDFTDPGEMILDPFAGSGTTLVAAKRLGRRAIGIEIDETYCAAAVRRLAQAALPLWDGDLFAGQSRYTETLAPTVPSSGTAHQE